MDWINPEYANVIAAMRQEQADQDEAEQGPPARPLTVRGFIIPDKSSSEG